jgi:hypothetical protein
LDGTLLKHQVEDGTRRHVAVFVLPPDPPTPQLDMESTLTDLSHLGLSSILMIAPPPLANNIDHVADRMNLVRESLDRWSSALPNAACLTLPVFNVDISTETTNEESTQVPNIEREKTIRETTADMQNKSLSVTPTPLYNALRRINPQWPLIAPLATCSTHTLHVPNLNAMMASLTRAFRYVPLDTYTLSHVFNLSNTPLTAPTHRAFNVPIPDVPLLVKYWVTQKPPSAFTPLDLHPSVTFSPHIPDTAEVTTLLHDSFKRRLRPDYWTVIARKSLGVFSVQSQYGLDGVAVMTREEEGWAYLDKFAVRSTRQGGGVSDLLWTEMTRQFPRLVWRSRSDNGINPWFVLI